MFQNHGVGAYAEVYQHRNGKTLVNLKQKREQNKFLGMWLRNLKSQGFTKALKPFRDSAVASVEEVFNNYQVRIATSLEGLGYDDDKIEHYLEKIDRSLLKETAIRLERNSEITTN